MKSKLPAFDVLVEMARNNPQKLEILRLELTKRVINSAASDRKRKRLEGLQFQVDLERKRARSPLAAAIKISEMMCHSLADLHRSMVTPLATDTEQEVPKPAKVIKFPSFTTPRYVEFDDLETPEPDRDPDRD